MRYRRSRTVGLVAATVAAGVVGAAVTAVVAHAAAGCRVAYTISSQWPGGFGANVAVTNLGDPLTSWTLKWTFPDANQKVTQGWNGSFSQSGTAVTVTNVSYNGSLGTNATVTPGFNGSWSGANPVPTSFSLNGVTCTGGTTTTAPTTARTATTAPTTAPTTARTTAPTTAPTTPRTTAPTTPPTTGGTPATGTVRVYWLKPTDKAYDQRYPDGIAAVMVESQRFFKQSLGKTFKLNNPVVEVVYGQHDTNWYITNNCTGTDHYWCVVFNMEDELKRVKGTTDGDSRWVQVGEISAEEVNKSGGGGGNGWVILSGHDADGAAGINGAMNRWYGGMVHELGHAFGLPDSTYTDGTCMSASFYSYPNCIFTDAQKNGMLTGRYGSFFS